ncbi:MAG: ERG2 family protein [Propionibacteriaceae bacterium]|nr:ERG2 family protein [Propionibacteriaceae bacterium]
MPVFSQEVVDECAQACLGLPKPQMFDVFARELDRRYPGVLDFDQPWIYSIAGGAMIQMKLYYASPTEYIMIWGTPIGSEGHSGRHFAGFWDTVIDGEMHYYAEGEFSQRVYKPGDRVYVGPGQARAMNFTDGVWAVEYCRGFIPASVPFGVASEILVCWDFLTAAQTLTLYTDLVLQSIGRQLPLVKPVTSVIAKLAGRATRALQPSPEVSKIPDDNIAWFQKQV